MGENKETKSESSRYVTFSNWLKRTHDPEFFKRFKRECPTDTIEESILWAALHHIRNSPDPYPIFSAAENIGIKIVNPYFNRRDSAFPEDYSRSDREDLRQLIDKESETHIEKGNTSELSIVHSLIEKTSWGSKFLDIFYMFANPKEVSACVYIGEREKGGAYVLTSESKDTRFSVIVNKHNPSFERV